jgi:hypothetical protein
MKSLRIWAVLLLLFCGACGRQDNPWKGVDANKAVPAGDPPFTPLTTSWVIDNAHILGPGTIQTGDAICERLKQDGIAEVVVIVQNGVKHPEDYATHYGRWLGLGKATAATEGGQNGLVWLIRPDADLKMTYSRGRGLPRFTSVDAGAIMDKARDFLDFSNYDKGVELIIQETDNKLRAKDAKKEEMK